MRFHHSHVMPYLSLHLLNIGKSLQSVNMCNFYTVVLDMGLRRAINEAMILLFEGLCN